MSPDAETTYDQVPYTSNPFGQTHPARLAAVGTLFGMRPAPVGRCRVLELGCAAGGNLIPMAVQFPDSRFVGVDLSARQVEDGRRTVAALGLENVDLRHGNIADVDAGYGKFDYLISHGVFSWVPTAVQEAMFRVARENLHPQGIAYLSYNTYPGWHMRGLIREMMRYHAANFTTPKIRTRQARGLLDFLATSVPQDGGAFATLLRQEVEVLRRHADHYLFHEHLEEVNAPLFFHQFVERAAGHRLQYLGEANVRSMMVSNLPEAVEKALRVMATDQIQLEQYMDFLRNRTFRETLLCHAAVRLNLGLDGEPLRRLWVASRAEPAGDAAGDNVTYRSPGGMALTTNSPVVKAAFDALRAVWPQALPFAELAARVDERLAGSPADADRHAALATRLMHAYLRSDLVEVFGGPLPFTTAVAERPVACPYARYQASRGLAVTTRRHEMFGPNPLQQALLPLLDGMRDRTQLLAALTLAAEADREAQRHGDDTATPEQVREVLTQGLAASLPEFSRAALLV